MTAPRVKVPRTPPEQAAAAVLQQARSECRDIGEPWVRWPIDVEFIASLLYNLGVKRTPGLSVAGREYSGLLQAEAGLIVVESEHHTHRRRFTIAHEIGHYVMHYRAGQGAAYYGDTPETLEDHLALEGEANTFAAELLMPLEQVEAMYPFEKGDPVKMARHFQVSPEAMERRLRRLGLPVRRRSGWG